ncbi:MAG TPA: hypothetical protein VGQ76_02665 [Thermoanaerobaculia bacterium]|jgi:hypothetical protein|nr:hypothetical protein [Thermoanaerobaculia bacterium]
MSVPAAARIGSLTLADDGKVTTSVERKPAQLVDGPIHLDGGKLMNADKVLAADLGTIDSLDLSEVRSEVAFSALHEGNFDIGLVNIEGGDVHWMPNDPSDEVAVQWAPRGHKISYLIRGKGGDLVRTLHIPSAYQFAIPFTNATIHALAWDPQAERYAVAYSTPDSSDRVEVLKYDGEGRRLAIDSSSKLDVEVKPFAPGAILLHPRDVLYDEKLPVVVWLADDFAWNDARAQLMRNARVALVVTKTLTDALWSAANEIPWLDASRRFVVGTTDTNARVTSIITEPTLPLGQYRRSGNIVAVAPAVVQSFAAGFIADQLKRDSPKNVSSR